MADSFHQTRVLLQAAKDGDEDARRELLVRHEERIRGLVRNRMGEKLRSREESSDLVQDVLLDLLRDLDPSRLDGEDELFRFIAVVVRNTVAERARKRGEEVADVDDVRDLVDGEPVGRDATSPIGSAQRNEDRARLVAAMDELSEIQRAVVQSRDIEGRAFGEIALELGKTEAAVQMLHHRAWIRLTDLLKPRTPRDPGA